MTAITKLGEYILEKNIGSGTFLASKEGTCEKFIIKLIMASNNIYGNETKYLKGLDNPKIFQINGINYILCEYCNGEKLSKLYLDYIEKYKRNLPEEVVQKLMRQIIYVAQYYHEQGICIGRCLRLDNIFINFYSEKDKQELNLMNAIIKVTNLCKLYYDEYNDLKGGCTAFVTAILGEEQHMIRNLGFICSELLTGKHISANLIKKGTKMYFIPSYLSLEAINFVGKTISNQLIRQQESSKLLVGMKDLNNLDFLSKNTSSFHKCDLSLPPIFKDLNLKGFVLDMDPQVLFQN